MRRALFRMCDADARQLLEQAAVVRLGSTSPDGTPLLRTLHAVAWQGGLAFHGSPKGEKMLALGRAAVAAVEQPVASIPSYFVDPERACPATTYYRSVQAHGTLEAISDLDQRAEVLAALMRKYQPEGGYTPISAQHALYRNAVKNLAVFALRIERLVGKAKLGQHKTPSELQAILGGLWQRGGPGDLDAIEAIREANPDRACPEFLHGPAGIRLNVAPGPELAPAAAAVVEHEYWNQGVSRETLVHAHRNSSAWLCALDPAGRVVGTARGLSDNSKIAWIFDVGVRPEQRGRGVGAALLRLMVDHPALRGVRQVRLATKDAQDFYARFGFGPERETWPRHPQRVRYPEGSSLARP